MKDREIKLKCYQDTLEDYVNAVESVCNQLNRLDQRKDLLDEEILLRDQIQTIFDLELSLASMCILLRKMVENQFITITSEQRRDINSIIHSNRFDFVDEDLLYVYSKQGKEEVSMQNLLLLAKSVFM